MKVVKQKSSAAHGFEERALIRAGLPISNRAWSRWIGKKCSLRQSSGEHPLWKDLLNQNMVNKSKTTATLKFCL